MNKINFEYYDGIHCETTTIGNLLKHKGFFISEPLLFGLGEGFDFIYYTKEELQLPFPMIGGKVDALAILHNLEKNLGFSISLQKDIDYTSAFKILQNQLSKDNIVGLKTDLYYLEYFDKRFHFPMHFITLYGLDDEWAYIIDCRSHGGKQRLSLDNLQKSLFMQTGIDPSVNLLFYITQIDKQIEYHDVIINAIVNNASAYLKNDSERRGIKGLRYIARLIKNWLSELKYPSKSINIIIDLYEIGGTGGANFRFLYLEFLKQAAGYVNAKVIQDGIDRFQQINIMWDNFSKAMRKAADNLDQANMIVASDIMISIADAEEKAMNCLCKLK